MQYERRYVWSILLRLFHWAFVGSIIFLVVTGFYVYSPWGISAAENSGDAPVLAVRNLHFLMGYIFTAAVLVRIFLLIFGNRFERFLDFVPVTPRNLKNLFSTIAFYLYLSRRHEHRSGHNALAGSSYIAAFVAGFFQIVSGFFLLFPESGFWQSVGFTVFGGQAEARFVHHLLMWFFLLFAFIHVYIAVWNDIVSPEGLISSMFNGRKFVEIDKG